MDYKKIQKLIAEESLSRRVAELGEQITQDYEQRKLNVICVLHGALVFAADLIRAITCPLAFDIIRVSSYEGSQSTGAVRRMLGPSENVAGTDCLVVDDILDTGLTLSTIRYELQQSGAASVNTCVLLDKPSRRVHPVDPGYTGFTIDDVFVIGYGLDYEGRFRNLPYIGTLNQQDQGS
ncbi:MAG: hypoxanthine phosphoribosyltransferase [Candidatus Pacebacteria bacterium]|nr:hypoxanthine phosphoribosyltransferase [Candidatus Paceibacterota bacterium]